MLQRWFQITSEVYQVGGPTLTHTFDAAIYLLRFGSQAALIDAGCGWQQDRLLSNIAATGTRLEQIHYLLLTHSHFDHSGGASALRERLHCRIVAHELDAEYLEAGDDEVTAATWYEATLPPFRIDRKLKGDGETIELGDRTITALHIPGHSPGSVAYLTDSDGTRVLFAQDVHGPLHPSLLSNEADYLQSLRRLLELEADILCEGHYGVFVGRKTVAEFIRSFLDRY